MALARIVTFDGVTKDRMEQLRQELSEGPPPADIPATELMVFHDADSEKSLVVVLFENDDDYRRGDAALNAMDRGDTPGERTSVQKYDVAFRMTN
jgi:hypothetical protein